MKKIWAIGILVVLATGITLGSSQPSLAPEPATDEEVAWIRDQIEQWKENPEMKIAASAILRTEKTVLLWVYERTPENMQLYRKRINGWEIIVVENSVPTDATRTDEEIAWIKDQMGKWKENPELQIDATAIVHAKKTAVLWVYESTPENQQLHRKMINGWEIIVVVIGPTDEEVAWIRDQIEKWKENPELRISATAVHRTEKEVILWVDERTPENEQLHHEIIDGWEIIVATCYEPTISDTFYDIFTNTPILWILTGCVFISLVIVFVKYRRRRKS